MKIIYTEQDVKEMLCREINALFPGLKAEPNDFIPSADNDATDYELNVEYDKLENMK